MLIGAVADDITGATDLRLMLSRAGLGRVQVIGVPEAAVPLLEADAKVIALKSRTIPATEAGVMSLAVGLRRIALDPAAQTQGRQTAQALAGRALSQTGPLPAMIHSSAESDTLARTQAALGREASVDPVEPIFAEVAFLLQDQGFSRVIVAGGETSGAVAIARGVRMPEVGPEIDPGIPWTRSVDGPALTLALKPGTFGAPDFFLRAWSLPTLDAAA